MRRVAADFGPIPEYAGESLDRVAALTEADYPLDGKLYFYRSSHTSYHMIHMFRDSKKTEETR